MHQRQKTKNSNIAGTEDHHTVFNLAASWVRIFATGNMHRGFGHNRSLYNIQSGLRHNEQRGKAAASESFNDYILRFGTHWY